MFTTTEDALTLGGSYFRGMTTNSHFAEYVGDLAGVMGEHRFDTIAVTGLSGTVLGPRLADILQVNLLIIRKPDDQSTHDSHRLVGGLGREVLFVDDFVSSGRTRRHVLATIANLAEIHAHTASYVGTYSYVGREFEAAREHESDADHFRGGALHRVMKEWSFA